jgi:hypothetical protein
MNCEYGSFLSVLFVSMQGVMTEIVQCDCKSFLRVERQTTTTHIICAECFDAMPTFVIGLRTCEHEFPEETEKT